MINKNYTIFFFIILFAIISTTPIFLNFITKDYSHFYIFDAVSAETVNFYLTKTYSLINNKSFFYMEKFSDYQILNQHDIIPNLIHGFFIKIFNEKSTIFMSIILFFITLVLMLFVNIKLFKFNLNVSGTLAIIMFIFYTTGPESVKTFANFFLNTKDYQFNIFRYNFPLINTFLFLIYLIIFFADYKKNKISKKLFLITAINGFSYFYIAVFITLNNLFYLTFLILKKNIANKNYKKFLFFFITNFFILINFVYLKNLHSSFTSHNTEMKLFFNLEYIISNFGFDFYRDNLVSLIIIIISFYFYLKKETIYIKIIYFHFLLNFLTLVELVGIDVVGFHFDKYILRPLNIISVTLIIFTLFKKNINFLLQLVSLVLVLTFCVSNYNFFKKINISKKSSLDFQKKVITDLKKFNKNLEIVQIEGTAEVFITSPYASSIFTSLNHKNHKKIYLSNGFTYRSNELSIKENVENFISFCKFFNFDHKNCYNLIFQYSENGKLSNFADQLWGRKYPSRNEFSNLYSIDKPFLSRSDKQLFIVNKSNDYYKLFITKLSDTSYELIEGEELILFIKK